MPKGYHHLTYQKRCHIEALFKSGTSICKIASSLSVHRSTIYRELRRNGFKWVYLADYAQQKSAVRNSNAHKKAYKMDKKTVLTITRKLKIQWSPDQIQGGLKQQAGMTHVSHETIYKLVWKDKREGGLLYRNLRRRGKKYSRNRANERRGKFSNRVDIDQRPAIVEEKTRIGDWELDTIVGADHSGGLLTVVDRASKYTIIVLLKNLTANEIYQALVTRLKPNKSKVFTLASDNGKEFSHHKQIEKTLKTKFFFAKPYHAWERGLNEHTNSLIRQYFPKKTRFDKIEKSEVIRVEKKLNHRPRKVLGYKTPSEVFWGTT